MPLTAQEKNQIAQGALTASQVGLTASLPATPFLLGPQAFAVLPFLPIALGITTLFAPGGPLGPPGFPIGPTKEELFGPVEALARRGLKARISKSPFDRSTVISTFDQDPILPQLVEEAAVRKFAQQQDFSELGRAREEVVNVFAETAAARGFLPNVPETLRGGVFRPTASAPIQFVEGNFL